MLDLDGRLRITDFGLADLSEEISRVDLRSGTPAYMAPEQAQNQDLLPSTDLYALGVILYEMLAGVPPFTGTNSLQIMIAQIQ